MPQPDLPLSRLQRLWLCEAIRLREAHAGPLEDAEANRRARQAATPARRIETRALWLAERDGLLRAQQHWLQGARLALLALAVLAILAGVGLARAALGDGQQPVNLLHALGSLLGLHLLALLGWCGGLLVLRQPQGLSRLTLWLSQRLARDAAAASLGPALLSLLAPQRLSRWLFGGLLHAGWLLLLGSALVTLLLLLASQHYRFIWASTLLNAGQISALLDSLGQLPALLGLPPPDSAAIQSSDSALEQSAALRQQWAGWLIGMLLAFGMLPRALLAAGCALGWQLGRRRLALDLQQPAYQLLAARLPAAAEVLDPAPAQLPHSQAGHSGSGQGALLVAVELDPERPWPPAVPATIEQGGVLDDRQQRRQLLERLAGRPVQRLLIACDPHRSPDRGTLALLAELSRSACNSRVWLLQAEQANAERLASWHQALAAAGLRQGDLDWLEHGDD